MEELVESKQQPSYYDWKTFTSNTCSLDELAMCFETILICVLFWKKTLHFSSFAYSINEQMSDHYVHDSHWSCT